MSDARAARRALPSTGDSVRKIPIRRREVPKEEALEFYRGEPYKLEMIEDLEDGTISFYKQGEFTDLCRGPHLPHTGFIKAFKLTSVAGSYWKGDARNKQLQRLYGTAWFSKKDLEAYLERVEEATLKAPASLPGSSTPTIPDLPFVDVTGTAGIGFMHRNGATGDRLLPETMGGGVAFLDLEGDVLLARAAVPQALGAWLPWPGSPTTSSVGTRTSTNPISAVSEQCHPIFGSARRVTPALSVGTTTIERPP